VQTLDHSVHSGMYGGAAPDAVTALIKLLATLHDEEGNVAVQGLDEGVAAELDYDEARFREESGLLDGVQLIGSGSILSRLWTKPSITTIGIDATSIEKASNTLAASAAAKVSMRLAPTQEPLAAFEALKQHLESHAPWGARVTVTLEEHGAGFAADAQGPIYDQARSAFKDAWGVDPVDMGVGGSIPFISDFVARFPDAAIVVTGVEDPDTRAHGANESLHLEEFARVCEAEAILLARLGAAAKH
jgi:acetylornithine deacetylase/succinyl-diaminopimelate desuccinylase-like protein